MVNVFNTDADPETCVSRLDRQRLGKQRLECKQIIDIVEGKGERKHPAIDSWAPYIRYLKVYYNAALKEWERRGYKNTLLKPYPDDPEAPKPWWFSHPQVHLSHRCALMLKNPEHYNQYFESKDVWTQEHLKWGYIWPINLKPDQVTYMQAGGCLHPSLVCSPLGSGIPSQHRLDVELVKQWLAAPTNNPATGRPIKEGGPKYKEYHKAATAMGLL